MRPCGISGVFGTKAETLALLRARGFCVPPLLFFESDRWRREPDRVLADITSHFAPHPVAVRSSARTEDTGTESMAGAFHSVLHVPCESAPLRAAVDAVCAHFLSTDDQVLIQPMLDDVRMAGVIMTRVLSDGSPYTVINYDDTSGRTDTVTGGTITSKTVYIYKGVTDDDFDSPRLRAALHLARDLETHFDDAPLDIEFAVTSHGADSVRAWLLQVRPICTSKHWKARAATGVSERIRHVETFVRAAQHPCPGFFGRRTLYGVMPDWNPAEIIGLVPRPLAFSLYRELVTRRVWSLARAHMGYHPVPAADLMLSMAGRPYIDVRASFNSLLPAGLPDPLAEKLVNAWLDRLDAHPELHDKVEFEIVPTVLDFDTPDTLRTRYPNLLQADEATCFLNALRTLTNAALSPDSTLYAAMDTVQTLEQHPLPPLSDAWSALHAVPGLLETCRTQGTLPFAIAARHAFMAEALLRSAVRRGALSAQRLEQFKRTVPTISGELSRDFAVACGQPELRPAFLRRYGHLRPGSYDILSPAYAQRADLFEAPPPPEPAPPSAFVLLPAEHDALCGLLEASGLQSSPEHLLDYAHAAIAGREYAKFVFSRHLSHILELLAHWGAAIGLSRAHLAMLPVDSVLDCLFGPLPTHPRTCFLGHVRRQRHLHDLASSFKLSQLIRSPRDVYIAPVHRATPNFITSGRVEAPVVRLTAEAPDGDLRGKLVCIESADPGYDWIFTRSIAGLITCFGGTNSHMAIRCAEYGLPAAIGCGLLLFERAAAAPVCILDCSGKTLRPLDGNEALL